jgi:DNA-binding NtrC family response regulator
MMVKERHMTITSSPVTPVRPAPCGVGSSAVHARGCAKAKGTVLLVESDAIIAELFATILEDEGYAVKRAATPRAALALLTDRGPDAFDLVLSVPFTDSLDAPYAWLDRLKGAAHAPVVICGRCPSVFYADHRRRGYAAFLEEPFDVQNLIDLVAMLCSPRPNPSN